MANARGPLGQNSWTNRHFITSVILYSILLQLCILALPQPDIQQTPAPSLPPSWQRINRELLESGGYYCYIRCFAKCVSEQGQEETTLEDVCVKQCQSYNGTVCASSDSNCWSTCRNLFKDKTSNSAPSAPQNVTVTYQQVPQPNPHIAELTWPAVPGAPAYVIKYIDLSDEMDRSNPSIKISTKNAFHFTKPFLCSVYAFAVAAASPYGVGQFSDTVILEAPRPIIPTPYYSLISAQRINEPFISNPDDPNSTDDNTTVLVLVAFAPPHNWNLTDEVTRVDANVHVVDAGTPRLSFSTDPVRVPGEPKFEIRLPGAVADTLAYCKFMFTVEKLFTKCDEEEATWYPSYAYNPGLNQTMPGLLVQLNCRDIKNSGCKYDPTAIFPSCGYKDVTTDVIHNLGSDTAEVRINFMPLNDPYAGRPILWYNITYGEGEKGTNTTESILFNLTKVIGSMKLENDTDNFPLPQLGVGKVYVVFICTVYDLRAQYIPGDWNEFQRSAVDLTTFEGASQAPPPADNQIRLMAMILVPLLIAVLIAAAVAVFLTSRKFRGKKLRQIRNQYADTDDRYVTIKKRYDHWELPRRRLHVDETEKLGSGAFGAVYKGRITGVLTKNRLAVSVLAENWMQAENSEVAVKMLPVAAISYFLFRWWKRRHQPQHQALLRPVQRPTMRDSIPLD